MRLLFCCEFYYPSVGGVQEVMRQIAERMVQFGHEVTVATSRLPNRTFREHNGVKIEEFGVAGNHVRGMDGEIQRYQNFVKSFPCDAILIKAAQQWTFDALWPVLDQIQARKVFIPCGFSGLYEPSYQNYFVELPDILRKFDHLIFYAEHYRDVDFAREHQLEPFTILANGASEVEFSVDQDPTFRQRHGIPKDSMVLLTVGSITGVKGHKELLEAFVRLKLNRRHVTFIMNGNPPPQPVVTPTPKSTVEEQPTIATPAATAIIELVSPSPTSDQPPPLGARLKRIYRNEGLGGICLRIRQRLALRRRVDRLLSVKRHIARVTYLWHALHHVWRTEGWLGVRVRLIQKLSPRLERYGLLRWMPASFKSLQNPIQFWITEARKCSDQKLLLVTDFPRPELVQAYMAADLFVFASNIEYSPLVLFESAAAGTAFLTVPVGNAEEIARWTGAGLICPADKDTRGYTRANPVVLAQEIAHALENPTHLQTLGDTGRAAWQARYTWAYITRQYEAILQGRPLPK